MSNRSIFLLYVSVLLLITFIQQEFVFIPELQTLDILSDDAKANLLEKYQKWRWVAFLLTPFLLFIRFLLVASCLFIGGFFMPGIGRNVFREWWGIATKAQIIMIGYSVVLCFVNVRFGSDSALLINKYTSLLFLGGDSIDNWVKIPLSSLNLFEIGYWFIMSYLISKISGLSYGKSFRFTMSSYGIGYLFYIVFLMFLVLYLG